MLLVLLRHGESAWNLENRFTGWTDVDLSPGGEREADAAGRLLRAEGLDFDVCYTSYLKRAIRTLHRALAQMDREWLPVYKTWKLNERHYGALQGLNKAETAAKFGEEQVRLWRRAFDVRPPALEDGDERLPTGLAAYREVPPEQLPRTESLADTIARAVPYFRAEIAPALSAGKRVLVAAHGNSLRALVMHLEGLSPEAIAGVNLPTGVPLVYELREDFSVADRRYLGDPAAVQAKMNAVANQGKAQPGPAPA